MRAVLQRVSRAEVVVDGQSVGQIGRGIVALVGVQASDDAEVMDYMLEKIVHLRIFEDEQDKMNASLLDMKGELFIVPNFTLYGDARKGRRPGYSTGAPVERARELFLQLQEKARALPLSHVAFGAFQEHMELSLVNDGPVTLLLDSDRLF